MFMKRWKKFSQGFKTQSKLGGLVSLANYGEKINLRRHSEVALIFKIPMSWFLGGNSIYSSHYNSENETRYAYSAEEQ